MRYEPTWESLRTHPTPQWFRDAKFGIYTHWGVYAVPACGKNATWYPYFMYRGGRQYQHHIETYGPPSRFGYKDFIPEFTAEEFDPDEWAELFKKAGAQFAGPVGEHHDGFSMWDSQVNKWNAARMGPKRDVVGELETAIRGAGMRFLVALHHAELWWFYPHWLEGADTADPRYAGLYGPPHNLEWATDKPEHADEFNYWPLQDKPTRAFLDQWLGKTLEVIDNYQPDILWFDYALRYIQEHYKRGFMAHYYNQAEARSREVVVTYKYHHLVPGSGVIDLELGRFGELTYHDWLTDTSVDDQGAWGYVSDAGYKPVSAIVHNLVDNVSKNGYVLLNVGPMADGRIPEQAREVLLGIGEWLDVNGEAIYGTTPWLTYGEGPTQMARTGYFSERQEVTYTAADIRFTAKGDAIYATALGWPGEQLLIESLAGLYESEIAAVRMLGVEQELAWSLSPQGLTVHVPAERPCDHAYVVKIVRQRPFR
jgi:alpha-L-fucosidase